MQKPESKNSYPSHPRVAVGAVVFRDDRVLLVKRGQPPGEGKWAIPGGSVELGETLQEAAEREIAEETGVTIRAGEPILTFDVVQRDKAGRVRFHYVIIDLRADFLGGDLKPGDDAQDARWVASRDLADLDLSPPTRDLLSRLRGDPEPSGPSTLLGKARPR